MRPSLLIVILLFSTVCLFAQEQSDRYEIGAGFAQFYLGRSDGGLNKKNEISLYAEWRHNYNRFISLGTKVDYSVGPVYIFDREDSAFAHYLGASGVATFHLIPNKYITPFICLGAGPAFGVETYQSAGCCFMAQANLRAGLELFRHLRISVSGTISYDIVHPSFPGIYMPASFSIGWSF